MTCWQPAPHLVHETEHVTLPPQETQSPAAQGSTGSPRSLGCRGASGLGANMAACIPRVCWPLPVETLTLL